MQTRAIHSGSNPSRNRGATSVPIYQSSSFAFSSAEDLAMAFEGRHPGYIYSRITNPTVQAFEQRVASMEGGIGSFAAASGMAAIQTLFYALTESGSRVIFARSLFGGTLLFLRDIAARAGVTVDFVDIDDLEALEAALAGGASVPPRFLFFETLGNPRLDIPPIHEAISLAADAGVPTIVDATLSSPALFDAKSAGAAAVLQSTTKYISGNGTVIGGAVTDLSNFDWKQHRSEAIAQSRNEVGNDLAFIATVRRQGGLNAGVVMSPFTAFLGLLGLESLPIRMRVHVENAQNLAAFLSTQASVNAVRYPGLESDPYFDRTQRYFRDGAGALLTFDVGSRERAFEIANHLNLVTRATNLGDAKTLIIHPASTIFHDCTDEEIKFSGVTEGLLRLSVGIEDVDDIKSDLEQALGA